MKKRILAIILTFSLVLALGMAFVGVIDAPIALAEEDVLTVSQVSELDFSLSSSVVNGATTSATSVTFDLAITKTAGDQNVEFSYTTALTGDATIDVSAIDDSRWYKIAKHVDGLSATLVVNYDAGSYDDVYFFRARRTVYSGLDQYTYTYYYSNSGLNACVVSLSEQNTLPTYYYLQQSSDPQFVAYQKDAHIGAVSGYTVSIVSDASTEIIKTVSATYLSIDGEVSYDTSSNASSVNSAITFAINDGAIYANRTYEYVFGQYVDGVFTPEQTDDGSADWRRMTGSTLVVDKQLLGEGVDTIDKNIAFRAHTTAGVLIGSSEDGTDIYGDEVKTYADTHEEAPLYVRWSVASPVIGVSQYYTKQGSDALVEYEIGKWASGDVTYNVELADPAFGKDVEFYWYDKSISIVGSNVTFGGAGAKIGSYDATTQKYSDEGGVELSANSVQYTVSATVENLRFAAKAGDIIYHYPVNCRTYIDKVKPSLIVTARDYQGNQFYESDSGAIFARDNITFTLTNNETCVSMQNAKYQYFDATGTSVTSAQDIREEDWSNVIGTTTTTGTYYNVVASASGKNQYLDGTYFFRIISGADVVSDVSKIEFSIDASDYYFVMDESEMSYLTTADGWAYEEGYAVSQGIKVLVKVKQKGIYRFFYNIASREGSEKELIPESAVPEIRQDPETGETVYVYTCWLKEGIVNGKFNFYAKNRADVQSQVYTLSDESLITIDSFPADVTIEGTIVGASSPIVEGTWVNGQVDIRIKSNKQSDTDAINVSGYEVYQVVGVNEIKMTPEADTGDYVIKQCSATNLYKFKFVTKAGVESEMTYQLNVESADIGFDAGSVKIYVENEKGQFDEEHPYTIDSIKDISVATRLKFVFSVNTRHVAPFDINLKNNGSSTIVTVEPASTDGVYIMDLEDLTADGMFATEPESPYTGSKTFIFNFSLMSVAIDKANVRKSSEESQITINVNRQIANIEIKRTDATPHGEWLRGPLTLSIANFNDTDGTEFRYQIGYGYNSALPTEWYDIDMQEMTVETGVSTTGNYRIYKYVLRGNFNGRIYVRALNSAGFVGGTQHASIDVAYDNTTPSVLRAIEMTVDNGGTTKTAYDVLKDGVFTDGTVSVSSSGEITIYSARQVRLISPESNQFAPTLFFAVRTSTMPSGVPKVEMGASGLVASELGDWQNLTRSILISPEEGLKSTIVYMYASNSTNHSDSMAIKVTIYLDSSEPGLEINLGSAGGSSNLPGESGVWVYHWSSFNEMTFNTVGVASNTKVYYQVNIDGTWYDLNDERDVNGVVVGKPANSSYNYVFDAEKLFGLINKRSIQATVTFRVVTETGATYDHPRSVKLQVDTEVPTFDLAITSDGKTYSPVEWDNNAWVSNIISFEITPTDRDANPGGVVYSYTFGADSTVHTTLQNLTFNSNNIAGLTYQKTAKGDIYCGEGELTIFARAQASDAMTSTTIYIRIDALEPEFEISATYMDGVQKQPVQSGDWVSVKEVNLELAHIGIKNVGSVSYENFSKVTVSYVLSTSNTGEPEIYANQSFPITEKTKITFTATTESGLTTVKTFTVNIDTQAPVVISRIQEGQKYYVDERISWLHDDDTIKISTLNGVQFSRGEIVSVETINLNKWTEAKPAANGGYGEGYCELYLEDLAGNKVYFYFYMLPSELTVDNITLSKEDKAKLDEYLVSIENACQAYENGGALIYQRALTEVRETFFRNHHSNLVKRLAVLESQVRDYQNYLTSISGKSVGNFTLQADYEDMKKNVDLYNGYAKWEQDQILEGSTTVDGEVRRYKTIFNTLVEAYYNLNAKMQVVETVRSAVQKLPARMVVEVEDYSDIIKAYDAYQSLSSDQKSVFNDPASNADLLGKLFSVKARCEELMLTDAATGVSISGDKLAEGKTIRLNVESVAKTTDDFINIQKKIMAGVDSQKPRAVIALYKLYLTGESSSNPTGTITIKLTIPAEKDSTGTEHRSYTAFAVYKYLSDGTLITVKDVKIAADGKSVSFEADTLGSYALASNANVVEKTKDDTVYAKIGSITIDGTMIVYIAIGAAVIFGVLIVVLIITGIRRRRFLDRYDRRHRYGLAARGISSVPKGNPARRRNPLNPNEYARPQTAGTELPKEKTQEKAVTKKTAKPATPQPAQPKKKK